jgi:hypothetical protein
MPPMTSRAASTYLAGVYHSTEPATPAPETGQSAAQINERYAGRCLLWLGPAS